jgi:predicted RNA-binding Zn ribbon-like protein
MEDLVDLARPVIEVRELVETFLGYDVVLDDWQDIVGSVLAAISGWVTRHPAAPAAVTRLATGLTALLQEGWGSTARSSSSCPPTRLRCCPPWCPLLFLDLMRSTVGRSLQVSPSALPHVVGLKRIRALVIAA